MKLSMWVSVSVLAAIALAASARRAEACSCREYSFVEHAKRAKQVLVVRAGKQTTTGAARSQPLAVLATLKGTPVASYQWDRAAVAPCDHSYRENEVAIVFIDGGIDLCSGNLPLAAVAEHFADVVRGAGAATGVVDSPAIEAAIEATLGKQYLHDRPAIAVRYAPLAGRSFTIGKSKLTYAKAASAGDVEVVDAVAVREAAAKTSSLVYVSGRYKAEGVKFSAIVHLTKQWTVVAQWTSER